MIRKDKRTGKRREKKDQRKRKGRGTEKEKGKGKTEERQRQGKKRKGRPEKKEGTRKERRKLPTKKRTGKYRKGGKHLSVVKDGFFEHMRIANASPRVSLICPRASMVQRHFLQSIA